MNNNEELARRFFAATGSNASEELAQVCSDDFVGFQNGVERMNTKRLIRFTQAVHQVVKNFHYANIECSSTGTGFVEEHDVCCILPDNSEFAMRVCVVAEVVDGKVTRMREYLDSHAAAGLMEALAG